VPTTFKVLLLLVVALPITFGAGLALRQRELPPSASVGRINLVLNEELHTLRELAMEAVDLDFGFVDTVESAWEDPGFPEYMDAVGSFQDRLDDIGNPVILGLNLRQSRGHGSLTMAIAAGDPDAFDGWIPFETRPTLGSPVVSRLLRSGKRIVQYAEVVSVRDGVETGFQLALDLALLDATYQAPSAAQD
jgi:hypothetical protein